MTLQEPPPVWKQTSQPKGWMKQHHLFQPLVGLCLVHPVKTMNILRKYGSLLHKESWVIQFPGPAFHFFVRLHLCIYLHLFTSYLPPTQMIWNLYIWFSRVRVYLIGNWEVGSKHIGNWNIWVQYGPKSNDPYFTGHILKGYDP